MAQARSVEIDHEILEEQKASRKRINMLMLGPGESGKSTIAKQMRIIHLGGFTEQERMAYKSCLQTQAVQQMQILLRQCRLRGIELEEENTTHVEEILKFTPLMKYDMEIASKIEECYNDPAIEKVLEFSNEMSLSDSAHFFLINCKKYAKDNYLPSYDDALRARAKTVGVVEIPFTVQKKEFCVIDVGGQRNERRKWIHLFEDVTAVFFVASLSDYDLRLEEDPSVNRMRDAVLLFEEVINNKWLRDTPTILFLNKRDLFEEKISRGIDLRCCYSMYTGGCDIEKATRFIREMFQKQNANDGRQIYTHVTTAIDTQNIRFVFNVVQDILLRATLDELMDVL